VTEDSAFVGVGSYEIVSKCQCSVTVELNWGSVENKNDSLRNSCVFAEESPAGVFSTPLDTPPDCD
jgi:hypothetical protein